MTKRGSAYNRAWRIDKWTDHINRAAAGEYLGVSYPTLQKDMIGWPHHTLPISMDRMEKLMRYIRIRILDALDRPTEADRIAALQDMDILRFKTITGLRARRYSHEQKRMIWRRYEQIIESINSFLK